MGLESRDYYRDGSYTDTLVAWGVDFTPVVKYLIITNVIVFLLQIFISRPAQPPDRDATFRQLAEEARKASQAQTDQEKAEDRRKREEAARKAREAMEEMLDEWASRSPGMRVSLLQDWLELDPRKTIEHGQVWRLVTCAFCHDRYVLWHILFNMLMLYWFGTRLERMYGGREFLLFYLTAAIMGSLAYVGLAYYTGSTVPAIGASGAVMGVMMLYVIYYPFETFLLFWVIPVPLWALLAVYVLYDLHPVLLALAGDRLFTGVAHAGHLGGLAFGFVYWRFDLRLEAMFGVPWPQRNWLGRRRRKATPLREAAILPFPQHDEAPRDPPPRDEFAERVDEILKKISEHGKDKLTEEERDTLIQASVKYRGAK